jgi:hypothetical protein
MKLRPDRKRTRQKEAIARRMQNRCDWTSGVLPQGVRQRADDVDRKIRIALEDIANTEAKL